MFKGSISLGGGRSPGGRAAQDTAAADGSTGPSIRGVLCIMGV